MIEVVTSTVRWYLVPGTTTYNDRIAILYYYSVWGASKTGRLGPGTVLDVFTGNRISMHVPVLLHSISFLISTSAHDSSNTRT